MPSTRQPYTGFGIRRVEIALAPTAPNTTPDWVHVPSVESAAFKMDVEKVDQYGDDKRQGSFNHSPKGMINIKGNKQSMRVFELVSGNAVSSSAGKEIIEIGTDDELIPPRLIARTYTPIRNDDGTSGMQIAYFYSCDAKTTWDGVPGSERAKLAEVSIQLDCYQSEKDERGNALTRPAFGRLEV
jgi:hypothetical protein